MIEDQIQTLPDAEEKPKAMLFDGWGFVPLPEAQLIVAAAKPTAPSEAA